VSLGRKQPRALAAGELGGALRLFVGTACGELVVQALARAPGPRGAGLRPADCVCYQAGAPRPCAHLCSLSMNAPGCALSCLPCRGTGGASPGSAARACANPQGMSHSLTSRVARRAERLHCAGRRGRASLRVRRPAMQAGARACLGSHTGLWRRHAGGHWRRGHGLLGRGARRRSRGRVCAGGRGPAAARVRPERALRRRRRRGARRRAWAPRRSAPAARRAPPRACRAGRCAVTELAPGAWAWPCVFEQGQQLAVCGRPVVCLQRFRRCARGLLPLGGERERRARADGGRPSGGGACALACALRRMHAGQ